MVSILLFWAMIIVDGKFDGLRLVDGSLDGLRLVDGSLLGNLEGLLVELAVGSFDGNGVGGFQNHIS